MELIRSNRTENLADALASLIRREPLGAFQNEVIVVSSRGMERWLTLALAERLGVWGNPSFPFPRAVIEEVLERALGASEKASAYSPDRLKWTIARLLEESAPQKLRVYLGAEPDPDRVLRFADGLSAVYDDYVVYRPEMLADWAKRPSASWQSELWHRVAQALGPQDLASRIRQALPRLRSDQRIDDLSFERLHVFALETVPPLFVELFDALSHSVPTTLYVLEPSREYLGDVLPSAEGPASSDGHTFLSSVGRLSHDFQQVLLSVDRSLGRQVEVYEAPKRTSLLSSLQADMFEFRSTPAPADRPVQSPLDSSMTVHACAGPMREAQVVYEAVQSALEEDSTLLPEDILVMAPNLEAYAPVFRAVFGQEGRHRIPYEVHDRLTREDARFYDDFVAVLEVLGSRFSVLDLLRLIDADSMRADFRFSPEERARLTELLAAAGVRWGIDAAHRTELEFPAEPMHTWKAGFGRLFLGFASSTQDSAVFNGLLPRGAPSLEDAALVARLSRLGETLFEAQRQAREPQTMGDWTELLVQLCRSLFSEDDEWSPAVRVIREALGSLKESAEQSEYSGSLSLKTIRRELAGLLQRETPAVGFLRRGVTIAELVPLRPVPFRLVCLVGMDEASFPRADRRLSFDVTRDSPRPGDRNQRHDDRHAFLQAILCARDRLIVTYGTPSSGSRQSASPSPLLWELRDAVNRYYQGPDGAPLLEPVVHPRHAFDATYFDGSATFQSSSRRHLQIAEALRQPPDERTRVELLAETGEQAPVVSTGELASWLWNPIASFIDRVLLARFDESELYEPTMAVTQASPLDKSLLGNAALRAGLRDDALREFLEAAPEFPDGTWGALERQALAQELADLNWRADELQTHPTAESELLSVELDGLVLEGRVDGLFPEQRLVKRFTKAGRRAELAAWVEHLLLQAATGTRRRTNLVLRGERQRASLISFAPPEDPWQLLGTLLEIYGECVEKPVPLLESASRLFAQHYRPEDRRKAEKSARTELRSLCGRDARLAYALGSFDAFGDERWMEAFEQAALAVYRPLFEHRSEP
ncbi:MAG: exodeoxyribonuclease V subunit gamma [Myxococcales bacterium]|nr:exodeoxyribonuclease V subunit gamma [Deltaproteobacteria bacterium]NND27022.1 exodeoxyribonuclease V subunit gamma [Myxococcales bacterium]NNK41642.1 exodeoxyribonuclease V subunit gamma [Myxococcales bacterium]RZV55499.1 MAG: exodeoxyribonuclease V subunit gamma [Deltaproteobacteria bacterium]